MILFWWLCPEPRVRGESSNTSDAVVRVFTHHLFHLLFRWVGRARNWAVPAFYGHEPRRKKYATDYVFGCARMYYGNPPDININKVFCITTFELGEKLPGINSFNLFPGEIALSQPSRFVRRGTET